MGNYLVSAVIPSTTGIPKDSVVNDFAVDTGATTITPSNVGLLSSQIAAFYNHVHASSFSVAQFISDSMSRASNACAVKVYDISGHLDGSAHGSPIATDAFTLDAAGDFTELPDQVACVLTLRGAGWSGAAVDIPEPPTGPAGDLHPRAQHTGRLYIGPLSGFSSTGATAHTRARPKSQLMTCLLDAAQYIQGQWFLHSPSIYWCVWSRKAEALYPITDAQVDDRFDIQRRRAPAPTARTTRTF